MVWATYRLVCVMYTLTRNFISQALYYTNVLLCTLWCLRGRETNMKRVSAFYLCVYGHATISRVRSINFPLAKHTQAKKGFDNEVRFFRMRTGGLHTVMHFFQ